MKELWNLYFAWFKMGLFTFGGGYAMLPMIQREVIQKYHWATDDEIMDYYAIGQVTPGIIAVNTATFVGYKVRGVIGGIVATLGVVSPSIIIISCIAGLIQNFSDLVIVQSALKGIQVAVCVLMVQAIIGLYKKGVKDIPTFLIFLGAFFLCTFTDVSTVWLVVLAGVIGYVMYTVKLKKGGEAK
ncbi:MAG: chromate transporter [Solobacterium sp.]|nr:chromate transporter [Solobacterium sp.]